MDEALQTIKLVSGLTDGLRQQVLWLAETPTVSRIDKEDVLA